MWLKIVGKSGSGSIQHIKMDPDQWATPKKYPILYIDRKVFILFLSLNYPEQEERTQASTSSNWLGFIKDVAP